MRCGVTHTINCAHQLPGTELHGHSYRITATVKGDVDSSGRVVAFEDLRSALVSRCQHLDHKRLEGEIGEPATAERLAVWIRQGFNHPVQIRVQVGDDGWVETE